MNVGEHQPLRSVRSDRGSQPFWLDYTNAETLLRAWSEFVLRGLPRLGGVTKLLVIQQHLLS